jgi:ABC-2 type transport system permease protein
MPRNENPRASQIVLRHESRELYKSATVWISVIALVVGTIYGLHNGANAAAAQAEIHRRTQSELLERLQRLRQMAADGNLAAQEPATLGDAVKLTLPVKPLAPLAIGQSDILPGAFGVGLTNKQRQPEDRYGYENPVQLRAGRVDVAFIVIFALPLLIIGLSFDVLSAEAEGRRLPFLLTAPVRVPTLLVAKLLPRFTLALATILVPVALQLDWSRELVLWAAAVAAYCLFWCGAAAVVNTRGTSSARNAISLLSVWLFLVIILPQIVSGVATLASPVRSRIDAVNASRNPPLNFIEDLPRLAREWYDRNQNLTSQAWNADNVPLALGPGFNLVQAEMDRLSQPVEKEIETQIARQQRMVGWLSFLSPAALMRELVNDLAGTGLPRHQSFRMQVDEFRMLWRRFFIPRTLHDYKMTPADYDAVPQFVFDEPEAKFRILLPVAGILCWAALAGVCTARRRQLKLVSSP